MDEFKDELSKKKKPRRSRQPRQWKDEELSPEMNAEREDVMRQLRAAYARRPSITYGDPVDIAFLSRCLNQL